MMILFIRLDFLMRVLLFSILILICSALGFANDINISTSTRNGTTTFFLQAGAFNLEKDAKQRQKELETLTNESILVKNLSDKRLYLVEIGPINDYPTARALQNKLSAKIPTEIEEQQNIQPSSLPSIQTKTAGSQLWNLRNADIRAVIAEVSRVTDKNFVIDPRVQGKISIVSSTPMNNDELYQVFLSVLQVSGFAAIPSGNIIKIIPNIDAKTQSSDSQIPPQGDDMMVAVVPVHYVPAEQLVPVLRPLMPQWSSISAYAPSNMLILSGRANNIQSLAQIINQVDSSSANGIDVVHLNQSLAMDITNTLKELVKTQPNMGNARSQITIAADDRSNSILISGSKTDRIRLRMLILKLDRRNADGLNSNTRVVYLHYLRAEDLVSILAGVAKANFSGTVGTTIGTITRPALDSTNPASNLANNSGGTPSAPTLSSSSGSSSMGSNNNPEPMVASAATANTSSSGSQNEGSTKPSVQIIAEPYTNSVIINAPASIINILVKVIKQLDIQPAQLLIEALVAEINQDVINDLGIEWGYVQTVDNVQTFKPGFAIINSQTKIENFQAQIYALATENKANILSTPSVMVLDNRQAKILVGKQVSVASTSYPNNAGGTTTASPFTTFDRVNVALHLYVRPQITHGKGIQLQIDQGNDTLDPATATGVASLNPTFRISSIVTSVQVESGDIVVLGGLTQDGLGNTNDRLPILGDLPGMGRFFKRNINTVDKRVLMVFIKPIIVHNERDTVNVTGEKYNHVRQLELDWLHSQDAFVQRNNATVMPAMKQADLPKPFSRPPLLATR